MSAKAILSASVSAAPAVYVEDVFSTFLYTGNGSTQTITNGIDLAGKGGLVWLKSRSGAENHILTDSARGVAFFLRSNLDNAQDTNSTSLISAFNNNGFGLGVSYAGVNGSGESLVSWTFRKQPKFFDVVTYTGTGVARTIAHNLGSTPGCIIVKRTDTTANWEVFHRAIQSTPASSADYSIQLNLTNAAAISSVWNSGTPPTSSVFSVGSGATVNASGGTYVAYLFAHDAGGFGTAGTDNVVSCGSFTTNGSGIIPTVNLGYEPQWIMFKSSTSVDGWYIADNMRGWYNQTSQQFNRLRANLSTAESTGSNGPIITPTGFTGPAVNFGASNTFIYIAIRRGPMKTPTVGTSVFSPVARTGTDSSYAVNAGFVVDLNITDPRNKVAETTAPFADRLRGFTTGNVPYLIPSSTAAEATGTGGGIYEATQNGVYLYNTIYNNSSTTYVNWMFSRAPGFFDEVCYTGTGSALNPNHNLGVTPELKIIKSRSGAVSWIVGGTVIGGGVNFYMFLETNAIVETTNYWSSGSDSATTFSTRAGNAASNSNGQTYAAYLFATLAGVSKVGSYTGTGTTKQIDCGFTAGARFVMIKRTDSTGDWYVWDTARGVISGNDPYLLLNSTAAEVTGIDYIDPLSSGFEISSTAPAAINANGGTYIFLAIA